jgi:hypothetical protein
MLRPNVGCDTSFSPHQAKQLFHVKISTKIGVFRCAARFRSRLDGSFFWASKQERQATIRKNKPSWDLAWRSSFPSVILPMLGHHPSPWHAWYGTARWQRIAHYQLRVHPLCRMCLERNIPVPATVCDHVIAHRGDVISFWLGPFQSLCKPCHDSRKRREELGGYQLDVGNDGWPSDPRHPANRPRQIKSQT